MHSRNIDLKSLRQFIYWALLRNLPVSYMPLGRISNSLRVACMKRNFAKCGINVKIERGAWFGSGEELSLGDNSGLGINCRIDGPVAIGSNVMMGPDVLIYSRDHQTSQVSRSMIDQGFANPKPIHIEDDVWIGARAIILSGVKIGQGSIIGAGSVVTKDVPPFSVAAGNPARVVKNRM